MTPGLYIAIRPLLTHHRGGESSVGDPPDISPCRALKEALLVAFPRSADYVAALCPRVPCPPPESSSAILPAPTADASATAESLAYPRLAALSLLPSLIEAAGGHSSEWILGRDAQGRPYATDPDGAVPFDFNLTHSARHVACALLVPPVDPSADRSAPPRVGIDVEEPIPASRAERLAARYCTDGERRLLEAATNADLTAGEISNCRQNSPNHRDDEPWPSRGLPWVYRDPFDAETGFLPPIPDFLTLWTVREAMAKQDGRGGPLHFDAAAPAEDILLLSTRLADTGASLTLCLPAAAAGVLRDGQLL